MAVLHVYGKGQNGTAAGENCMELWEGRRVGKTVVTEASPQDIWPGVGMSFTITGDVYI